MSSLPPLIWLVSFRFIIFLFAPSVFALTCRGLCFPHTLSYFVPVSASQQELAYTWFRDLLCSCAFSWLKEKVLVFIQSSPSVCICTELWYILLHAVIFVAFIICIVLGLCYDGIVAFKLMLNIKCCTFEIPTRNKYSCILYLFSWVGCYNKAVGHFSLWPWKGRVYGISCGG